MFTGTIGETRPKSDANEPQEDAQGTRQIRQGRLNSQRAAKKKETSGTHRAKTKDNVTSNQLSTQP